MLAGLTLGSAALLSAWFLWRREAAAAAGVAGGAGLGLGSFFLLERFVRGLGPAEGRPVGKALLALGGVAAGCLLLALVPGSIIYGLIGFSCYVGALVLTAVWEASHA